MSLVLLEIFCAEQTLKKEGKKQNRYFLMEQKPTA